MAEIPFSEYESAPNQGHSNKSSQLKSAGTLANWAGAAISLGLIVGVGIWGYRLLARDVSGVPVVRAAQGPMRIQPETPGGSQADNQGLSVNSVAADGMAAPTADRLVLAPRPVELEVGDSPSPILAGLARESAQKQHDTGVDAVPVTPQMASIQALAEQLTSGATTLGEQVENTYVGDDNAPGQVAVVTPAAVIVVPDLVKSIGGSVVTRGLGRSLRPHLRPASLRTDRIIPANASTGQTTHDIDATTIAVGTRLVQLGAFDSAEIAKSEWERLNKRFGTYLEGKSRVVQKAQSGGRTFYRLRAMGFDDIAAARRFCSALAAERADCIPVVTR